MHAALDAADALLVAGSSLAVMSGLRFVRYAAKAGMPVVIVNRGVTRGDDLATYKVDEGCSEFLRGLVAGFEGAGSLVSQNSQGIEVLLTGLPNPFCTSQSLLTLPLACMPLEASEEIGRSEGWPPGPWTCPRNS